MTVGGFEVAATLAHLADLAGLTLNLAAGRRLQQQGPPKDEAGEGERLQGSASVSALGGVRSGRQLLSSGSTCCDEGSLALGSGYKVSMCGDHLGPVLGRPTICARQHVRVIAPPANAVAEPVDHVETVDSPQPRPELSVCPTSRGPI